MSNMKLILSWLLLLFDWTQFVGCETGINSKYHIGYRKVSWCVTGKDEPELHEWPFSQFVPLLRRTNRYKLDDKIRYDLRFGDITTNQKDIGLDGRLYKTMHVMFKAEQTKDATMDVNQIWEPLPIEGLIIQANSNPYTMALPTGQFFPPGSSEGVIGNEPLDAEIHCTDCDHRFWGRSIMCRKRAIIHPEHPTILAWHHMQKTFNYSNKDDNTGNLNGPPDPFPTDGKQNEVHSNFRFYSPKCAPTRRMMFTILVVRSFVKHQYDIFFRGPYEVTLRDQENQSDLHPSPYFYMFTQSAICHHTSSSDLTLEHPQKFQEFEMNHYFDCCIREEENKKTKVTVELLGWKNKKSVSCEEKLFKKHKGNFDPRTIVTGDESFMCFYPFMPKKCRDDTTEISHEYYEKCPPCKTPPTTTTLKSTKKPYSIYKRTVHGGLMIMTNFCLQPIVIHIARFYKETFNTSTYKGAKAWYWMHLLGGMVSSGMVYFGYFSGGNNDRDAVKGHVVVGNVYIVTLALCYGSAWGRHKNTIITKTMELIHGCFGYVTISLAIASVESAPGLGMTSKLLVYLMVSTQCFFMVIMTCHIVFLDKKIGMRPKRRHFPTVEARFDEIEVPGGKFRVYMLIIFASMTFLLSTASTFFE